MFSAQQGNMDMGVDPGHFLTTHFDIKSSDIIQICKYKNKQETEKNNTTGWNMDQLH